MTVAGVAAYYISSPGAASAHARLITRRTTRELQPIITPVLAIFRVWRGVKRMRDAAGPA
jgi:hypothetical protein